MNYAVYVIVYAVLPMVTGIGAYLVKNLIMQRIDILEHLMETKITEQETRQLISDKLDPMKEDLQEIKARLNQLFDLYLQNNTGK